MATTAMRRTTQRAAAPAWAGHAAWVAAGALVGFAIPAIFAGWFALPRALAVLGYLLVAGPFLYGYARWAHLAIAAALRRRWAWGVIVSVPISVLLVFNVLGQP